MFGGEEVGMFGGEEVGMFENYSIYRNRGELSC